MATEWLVLILSRNEQYAILTFLISLIAYHLELRIQVPAKTRPNPPTPSSPVVMKREVSMVWTSLW